MRKHSKENHDLRQNHDRWLISYADFITLMFAFFVVLYAMNTLKVNATLSNDTPTLKTSSGDVIPPPLPCHLLDQLTSNSPFSGTMDDVLLGLMSPLPPIMLTLAPSETEPSTMNQSANKGIVLDLQNAQISHIAEQLRHQLQFMIEQGKVDIIESNWGISIDINASILFNSAEASPNQEARQTLNVIADLLRSANYPIRVEGYTDNKPIHTHQFPSNWELSSSRASGVVRYFIQVGIAPDRLAATGFGENHPVADNKTEDGRARNRRVVLKVMAEHLDTPKNPQPETKSPAKTSIIP